MFLFHFTSPPSFSSLINVSLFKRAFAVPDGCFPTHNNGLVACVEAYYPSASSSQVIIPSSGGIIFLLFCLRTTLNTRVMQILLFEGFLSITEIWVFILLALAESTRQHLANSIMILAPQKQPGQYILFGSNHPVLQKFNSTTSIAI